MFPLIKLQKEKESSTRFKFLNFSFCNLLLFQNYFRIPTLSKIYFYEENYFKNVCGSVEGSFTARNIMIKQSFIWWIALNEHCPCHVYPELDWTIATPHGLFVQISRFSCQKNVQTNHIINKVLVQNLETICTFLVSSCQNDQFTKPNFSSRKIYAFSYLSLVQISLFDCHI